MINNSDYTSNRLYYYLYKYLLLCISLIILFPGVLGIIDANFVSFNNEPISTSASKNLILTSTFPLVLFLLLKDKFVLLQVNKDGITFSNKSYKWNQISSITQILFVFPPLYKLKIEGVNKYFLFNTENQYLWISVGLVKDLSGMKKFIDTKIKE